MGGLDSRENQRRLDELEAELDQEARDSHTKPSSKFTAVWTPQEDRLLLKLVHKYGEDCWNRISKMLGAKSEIKCNERYLELTNQHHLISSGTWTEQEDSILAEKVSIFGPRNWN